MGRGSLLRLGAVGIEAVVAVGAALLMLAYAGTVAVDPLERVGQVSALAHLQIPFAVAAVLVLTLTAVVGRRPTFRELVPGITAALLAGLTTGVVAGGVRIALAGTSWGLFADGGDARVLAGWAADWLAGGEVPPEYPPMYVWALGILSDVIGQPTGYALKELQLVSTALMGPACYLAWRAVAGPFAALCLGVVAALPVLDAYKPYSNVVLVLLVPLLAVVVRQVRAAPQATHRQLGVLGAGLGLALGLLALTYSGWFVWSAPGAVAVLLLVVPWDSGRAGLGRVAVLLGTTAVVLFAVAGRHLVPLVSQASEVADTYFYFDALVDPAYVAMWRNDFGGGVGPWPPPGELGGVGVFTVLLAAGLALAVATALRRSVVAVALACFASAWVMRYWFAAQMYDTQTVQLWPRTTAQILYCLLVLGLFGLGQAQRRYAGALPAVDSVYGGGRVVLGAFTGVALLLATASSATADRYMPSHDGSTGELAWAAHTIPLLDGTCPPTAPRGACPPVP